MSVFEIETYISVLYSQCKEGKGIISERQIFQTLSRHCFLLNCGVQVALLC